MRAPSARFALLAALTPALATAQAVLGPPWNGAAAPEMIAAPAEPRATRSRALFARALIVGASVSSDYKAPSPGRLIARGCGTEEALISRAHPGARGSERVRSLTDEDFARATVVVALDLFFWDASAGGECAGLDAVPLFFRRAHATPVVIGNVPALRGGAPWTGQSCRPRFNAALAAACAAHPDCVLVDLESLWARASGAGGMRGADGRFYAMSELLPDGLHMSLPASEIVARLILKAVDGD